MFDFVYSDLSDLDMAEVHCSATPTVHVMADAEEPANEPRHYAVQFGGLAVLLDPAQFAALIASATEARDRDLVAEELADDEVLAAQWAREGRLVPRTAEA